jgi:TPR repeat protein
MRCVIAALVLCGFAALFQPNASTAAPMDLDTIIVDETPEQLCDRLASDPFAGFGPVEWAQPFHTIDFYRAGPACAQAMKKHPNEPRFALGTALASIAGKRNDDAKKLLAPLVAKGNISAILALAYISPEAEAADLMHQAAEAGSTPGMILFGMTQITGKGIDKNTIDGVRMIRRAADSGSTRAMLILANFYNSGAYGVGLNPAEAKSLIAKAASLGDPAAKDMLASLDQGGQDKKAQ